MVEKITALVFSVLLLALSILLTIHEATVENIAAIVFSAIAVVCNILSLVRSPKIVTLSDCELNGQRDIDAVMKLGNEIAPYIIKKDGKVSIRVIR